MVRRWSVRGRVQGVGFRWFVRGQAKRLDLGGYARNLPDGSVEVAAEGPATALDRLEQALRRGPPMGRVEAVDILDVPHEITLPKPFETW